MYKDFADFISELLTLKVIDLTKAQHITEKFLLSQSLLTKDEIVTLEKVKVKLDTQELASQELAKGT
jgi:hypothetical protein